MVRQDGHVIAQLLAVTSPNSWDGFDADGIKVLSDSSQNLRHPLRFCLSFAGGRIPSLISVAKLPDHRLAEAAETVLEIGQIAPDR